MTCHAAKHLCQIVLLHSRRDQLQAIPNIRYFFCLAPSSGSTQQTAAMPRYDLSSSYKYPLSKSSRKKVCYAGNWDHTPHLSIVGETAFSPSSHDRCGTDVVFVKSDDDGSRRIWERTSHDSGNDIWKKLPAKAHLDPIINVKNQSSSQASKPDSSQQGVIDKLHTLSITGYPGQPAAFKWTKTGEEEQVLLLNHETDKVPHIAESSEGTANQFGYSARTQSAYMVGSICGRSSKELEEKGLDQINSSRPGAEITAEQRSEEEDRDSNYEFSDALSQVSSGDDMSGEESEYESAARTPSSTGSTHSLLAE
ncbi:hypothetical protein V865_004166 [Kwoniella europaea PYCC6329]|uniref:Uncharacterized protein n=1 Tax=Kwoniella europaea PYCC6329 TaxID=1423913 RepID=A0AAX4KHU7_9TREE